MLTNKIKMKVKLLENDFSHLRFKIVFFFIILDTSTFYTCLLKVKKLYGSLLMIEVEVISNTNNE